MSTIPKQDVTMTKSNVLTLLTALLLGWFFLPLVQGAAGAVLFFVVVAIVILILRLLDRADALWAVVGIIIGVLIGLLLPAISSNGLGDAGLIRTFLVLWLVFKV